MIYAALANIPCILLMLRIRNKKTVKSEQFIEAILGAIAAYIFTIITGSIIQGFGYVINDRLPILVLGTLLEEVFKIIVLLFISRTQINKYQVVVFGLTFAIIENLGWNFINFTVVLLRAFIWFTHSAFLIIFIGILHQYHKTRLTYLFGMLATVLIHILHNIVMVNMNVIVFSFYLVILFNSALEIFKRLPNNYKLVKLNVDKS